MKKGAWKSKAGWSGKAHFVYPDGSTACAKVRGPHAIPMGQLFTAAWTELDDFDHLCAHCQKISPRECRCGRCSVRPRAKERPS